MSQFNSCPGVGIDFLSRLPSEVLSRQISPATQRSTNTVALLRASTACTRDSCPTLNVPSLPPSQVTLWLCAGSVLEEQHTNLLSISTARSILKANINATFKIRLVNTVNRRYLFGKMKVQKVPLYHCLLSSRSSLKQSIVLTKLWCIPVRLFLKASFLRQHISTEVSIRHFNLQKQAEGTNRISGVQKPTRSLPLW